MADEAKDQDAISKTGTTPNVAPTPQPQTTEPEVHILEEHVTRAAQKPAVQSTGNPVPAAQAVSDPIGVPETKPAAPKAPTVSPSPTPTTPVPPPAIAAPSPTPRPVTQPDTVAEDVGLVQQTRNVPTPIAPPIPPSSPVQERPTVPPSAQKIVASSQGEHALGNDIAKILAEVKLPERRSAGTSADKLVPSGAKKFDTGIVGSALNEGTPSATTASQSPQASTVNTPTEVTPATQNPGGMKVMEKNPSSVVAVHTLKDDLQAVVHDQKISVVRAVSLEEDRRAHKGLQAGETLGTQQRSSRTFGILFASLTLIGLGSGALFGVLFIMNQQKAPAQIDTGTSILFAEQSVLLSLDAQSPQNIKRALSLGRTSSQGALGSITRVIPVTAEAGPDEAPQNRPATFREFMAALGAHPPDDLLRALGDDFFLGIHAADESAPLIVIPVASHSRAFAAMLRWEEALNSDFVPLFTAVPTLTFDGNGVPSKRTYEDLIMRNYDVRALKDDAGEVQIYYSFPTQNILIIAESPYSFPEILSRLQAGRQL